MGALDCLTESATGVAGAPSLPTSRRSARSARHHRPHQRCPRVRQITSWLLRRPEDLDTEQQLQLRQMLASCPHLDVTATHVRTFAEMLTGRHRQRLDSWMATVDTDDLPHLHRFVNGLKRDYQLVRNGLTLSHSSGTVEGNVNRMHPLALQFNNGHDRIVEIRPTGWAATHRPVGHLALRSRLWFFSHQSHDHCGVNEVRDGECRSRSR
ncbi:MAG: DesA/ISL3 alpha bundle tail domain-containing protein [Pseudonocardiaceae bacterium]